MSVNLFVRNSARVNAFAGAAPNVSPNVKYSFYFRPNPNAYARVTSQPARFSSHDVAQAKFAIASALILIGAGAPTATRMQALRVLLRAYAALNAVRQPAPQQPVAQQTRSAASHRPAQTPASSRQSDASAGTKEKSSRTRYSAPPPRSHTKSKSHSTSSGAKSSSQQQSAYESKRAKTEKPSQAPAKSDPVASAFKVLDLPATATFDEVKRAYKKAALKYHPDRGIARGRPDNKEDLEMFKAVNEAHEILAKHFGKA